ncbi:hypothetical protein R3X26_02460 [Vibrio sp. TH_r3]|uniref:hypothetical protein n=1 Tax=Vibrio sp. TH_r3 TaxID=3082084 RepID=UPI002952B7CF|nr:hypothetical protein [Vibrio sp. TH_r3]MDV7103262.1 hypothetical protein [Vibrio sp. TH_r3]
MKKLTEDQDIISLYKSDAKEQPSEKINKTILDYAKAQSKGQTQIPQNKPHKGQTLEIKGQAQKNLNWWPYLSLAASVTFISILTPWQWLDQTNISPSIPERNETIQLDSVEHKAIDFNELKAHSSQTKTFRNPSPMKPDSHSEEFETMDKVTQGQSAKGQTEPKQIAQNTDLIFSNIERLLAEGKQDKAREQLLQLIDDNPKLEQQVPESLRAALLKPEYE